MQIQLSDLIDRYSILRLKSERLPKNKDIEDELNLYRAAIIDIPFSEIEPLYIVNGKIWSLEADIRNGKDGILGLEEVGRRALQIRDLNKVRISLKNAISNRYGGFEEVKGEHASM